MVRNDRIGQSALSQVEIIDFVVVGGQLVEIISIGFVVNYDLFDDFLVWVESLGLLFWLSSVFAFFFHYWNFYFLGHLPGYICLLVE